jgi:hypothetical protein
MVGSSTLGDWIQHQAPHKRKTYPEKLCACCGENFTPKNARASEARYWCYGWRCEELVEREKAKAARQRYRERKERARA